MRRVHGFCALVLATALLVPVSVSATALSATEYQVINGRPADAGEYPAMAALIDVSVGQFCGGTLIDAEWVVTAAHCFYDARTGGSSLPPSALEIALNTANWAAGGERVGVDQIVLHPAYDEFRTVNDIALLHLASPAATPPAPLVGRADAGLYGAGRQGIVTGYGATTPYGENPSVDLLEVEVPLVADADCAQSYDLEPDRHVCAGAPGSETVPGNDTCQGDSGGPLWTDPGDGTLTLIGVTSFGALCGVDAPGVYTEVISYLGWVEGIIDGTIEPGAPVDPTTPQLPDGADLPYTRISSAQSGQSDPVLQAVAISRHTFREASAPFAALATSSRFPDALAGSSLAYGLGPLLFTDGGGAVGQETLGELRRVLAPGAQLYLLGGTAVIPAATESQLRAEGYDVVRLAGSGREQTAAVVAQAIVDRFGSLPLDTVIVATGGNWPDAVTVGEIGSWWGTPVLLTPTTSLNVDTAALLGALAPSTVLIAGGTLAISDSVVDQIESITGVGTTLRLGGDTRFGTAAAVTRYNLEELYGAPPSRIVGVNLRREPDAFAHVLAASMLTGAFSGVMAATEGDAGTDVPADVRNAVCGLDLPVLVAGDTDLISDGAARAIQDASAGVGCQADRTLGLGDAITSAITPALAVRSYTFSGTAGQTVRIRMDALPVGGDVELDPIVELYGPDGQFVAVNDDTDEGTGLNSLLVATLPADGVHRIDASSFAATTGGFVLSLDPPAVHHEEGTLSDAVPESFVTVSGTPGTRVVVEMRSRGSTDPFLYATDPSGNEIGFDDDGGGYPNARMTFQIPASGQAQIVATAYGAMFGPYALSVFAPEAPITVN